jgi:hypothetical protein
LCAVLPAARRRLVWLVLVLAVVTGELTPVTTGAGEWLFNCQRHRSDILRTHAERGDRMIYFSVALVVLAPLTALHLTRAPRKSAGWLGR